MWTTGDTYGGCTRTHSSLRCWNCGVTNWYTTGIDNWNTFTTSYAPVLEPLPKVPKNWRWFHALARPMGPLVPRQTASVVPVLRRIQERFPAAQRAHTKRRAWLQSLAAL